MTHQVSEKEREALENALELAGAVGDLYPGTKTFQQMLHLKDKDLDRCMQHASRLLADEAYRDAADAFLLLCTLNPHYYESWLNLAIAEQCQGNHELALEAAGIAILTNAKEATPHLVAAECYLALGNISDAQKALRLASSCADQSKVCGEVRQRVLTLKQLITAFKKERGKIREEEKR